MAQRPAEPVPSSAFQKYFSGLKTSTYSDNDSKRRNDTIHRTVAWSVNGIHVATGASDRTIRVWNIRSTNKQPQCELKGHTQDVNKILFNPTKEHELASCGKDGSVRFWDTRSKTCTTKLEVGGDLISMSWSGDGLEMVVGNKHEVLSLIRTTSSPVLERERFKQGLETNQTCFSNSVPARDLLVTKGDGTVRFLDFPSFDQYHQIYSHTAACTAIAFSPTGKYVAVGGNDGVVALWKLEDCYCVRTWSNPAIGKITGLSWSWDGRYLVAASEEIGRDVSDRIEGIPIFYTERDEPIFTLPTRSNAVPAVAWHSTDYSLAYVQIENGKSTLKVTDVGDAL